MPPRTKVVGGLVGLTASDSEPDFDDVLQTKTSATVQPVKRRRGRPPAASKITKHAQKQGRSNSARPVSRTQGSPRRVLADKSNNSVTTKASRIEESWPEDHVHMLETRHSSSPAKPVKPAKGRPKATKAVSLETEDDDDGAIAEGEPMEVESGHSQNLGFSEDSSDITLRRKLGDLARKYESLEARHRELRQVGVVEAERNFERLQKQAEENSATATKLINELKAELAAQIVLVRKGEDVKKQLERSESKCASLQSKLTDVSTSLMEAKSEIKMLSTKLAASRSAEATVTVPGSALKPGAAGTRAIPSNVVQAAQAKEDLYGDLTGLIVRGVSLGKEEDVFDCIQTGRNGTLHFKLALDKGDNYDDVQFTYRPQLDESRDEDLIDMLPDYLVEEITFSRTDAVKFHARVMTALTRVIGPAEGIES